MIDVWQAKDSLPDDMLSVLLGILAAPLPQTCPPLYAPAKSSGSRLKSAPAMSHSSNRRADGCSLRLFGDD